MKKLPKFNIKRKLLIGLTLSIVLSVVTIATAQELQRTVTLVYPSLEHTIDPGGRTEGITKIINDSSGPLTFNLNVQDFVVTDTLGTPNILPPNTLNAKYSAAAWIGVTPDKFTLKPGEKQIVNYYIQVPKDARPGGHYAAIVYTPVVNKPVQGTGGTVQGQLGSIFYVTVNGPITESANVSKFLSNSFQEYGPVSILTQIQNLGDLHILPKGTVTVSGLFYNQTQDLPAHNIFPQAKRDYANTFGQTFMLGRYKAVLLASYGVSNNLPLTATLYFWVFPWRLTLIIVLLIVAIVLGYIYFKKRKKEGSKDNQEAKKEENKEESKAQVKVS
jgi:uncharacterized membrane protein (DUF485 family)